MSVPVRLLERAIVRPLTELAMRFAANLVRGKRPAKDRLRDFDDAGRREAEKVKPKL